MKQGTKRPYLSTRTTYCLLRNEREISRLRERSSFTSTFSSFPRVRLYVRCRARYRFKIPSIPWLGRVTVARSIFPETKSADPRSAWVDTIRRYLIKDRVDACRVTTAWLQSPRGRGEGKEGGREIETKRGRATRERAFQESDESTDERADIAWCVHPGGRERFATEARAHPLSPGCVRVNGCFRLGATLFCA